MMTDFPGILGPDEEIILVHIKALKVTQTG